MSVAKYIGLSFLLVLLVAISHAQRSTTVYVINKSTPLTTVSKKKLLTLVNEVRAEGCNCSTKYYPPAPPVTWHNKLEDAAIKHSKYMYKTKNMSHYGPKHNTPGDRLRAEGYSWRQYGENVALGYTDEEAVIKGWLRSGGHCKNIMNPSVKHMGVARVNNYWTQLFARP